MHLRVRFTAYFFETFNHASLSDLSHEDLHDKAVQMILWSRRVNAIVICKSEIINILIANVTDCTQMHHSQNLHLVSIRELRPQLHESCQRILLLQFLG
jgi:hypothetical protein